MSSQMERLNNFLWRANALKCWSDQNYRYIRAVIACIKIAFHMFDLIRKGFW